MNILKLLFVIAAPTLVILAISLSSAHATDILVNGGLENGAGPQGWTLTQTTSAVSPLGDYNNNGTADAADYVLWRKNVNTSNALPNDNGLGTPINSSHYDLWRSNFGSVSTGGLSVSASEQISDAQEPPATGNGLLVKPYAGNTYPFLDQNLPVNLWLTQTYVAGPAAAGKTYTFSGDSTYQGAYSGNIDTLYPDAPSGPIASPTKTQFQLSFLNSSNVVLSTSTLDLPKHRADTGTPTWVTSSLSAVAPTGTFKVQVTLAATNMLASCSSACPFGQDVRFDNFSLKDSVATTTDRLVNGSLDAVGIPAAWSLQTVGNDGVQFSSADFAVHSGNVGMWLRSFQGNNPNPPANNPGPIDAVISQVVPATPGQSYTYSAWAKLQQAYSGLDPTSGTQTFIKMEFLDNGGATIGSPVSLELGPNGPLGPNFWPAGPDNGQGVWQQVSLPTTVAPAGTANIRVYGGATGMITEADRFPGLAESAMFDDFSLIAGSSGSGSGNLLTGALAAASVPEPTTVWLALLTLIGWSLGQRRRT
ncbi:MAG TPA: hypothetical protein VHE81_09300 [Lacipirellulaceae bacterium]|nr:hypothetical protein [Lacipirellulaceae bacterium]